MLLPVGVRPAWAAPAAGSGSHLDRAWERYDSGDWTGAEAAFIKAIEAGDRSPGAYRGLCETLYRQEKFVALTMAVSDAVPHLVSDPAALRSLAEILGRQPVTREGAVGLYRMILADDPSDAGLRMELARQLAWTGRHGEAVDECRRVRTDSGDPDLRDQARRLEAQALSWNGNQKEALPIYRDLSAAHPDDPSIAVGIADAYAWSGRSRRAEQEYTAILRDHPSPEAHIGLGEIARWEGRPDDARDHLNHALALRPGDPRALDALARLERNLRPTWQVRADSFGDNSDWDREALTAFVDFHKGRPLQWRAGAARFRYEQADGRQIYRTAVPVQAFWKPGRAVSGAAGLAWNGYGDGSDTVSGFVHGFFNTDSDRLRWRAGFDRYDMIDHSDPLRANYYNQADTIDVVPLDIYLEEMSAGLFYRFTGRLTLDASLARAEISDDNERWISFDRLSYRLPARDRVDLFGQFYYQGTDDRSPLYFDPANFQGYSVGVLWEGDRGSGFRFLVEASAGYFPRENDHAGGQLHGYVEWDLREHLAVRLTGNYLNSPAERGVPGENYESHYVGLTVVGRFPRRAAATPD